MTQTVTVPGVGDLSFPDGMSQPDMAAAIQKNFPQIHKPQSFDSLGDGSVAPTGSPAAHAAQSPLGSPSQNFAAGAGKAVVDLGRGAGQFAGLVSRQDVANSRAQDAPLMGTTAGKLGNFAGNVAATIPTAFIPGANTLAGAGVIGAVAGAFQPSTSTQETLTNIGAGGAVGVAGQAIGSKLSSAISNRLAARQASAAADQSVNADRDAVLAAGRKEGYVVPPTVANPNATNTALESIGGKAATRQAASAKNQVVTNDLTRGDLGLQPNQPLSRTSIQSVIAREGAVYPQVEKALGNFQSDAKYTAGVQGLPNVSSNVASAYPGITAQANAQIQDLAKSLDVPTHSGDSAVDLFKLLNERAKANFNAAHGPGGADSQALELGRAQSAAANEVGELIQRQLASSGQADLAQSWSQARVTIAKAYQALGALKGSDISAPALASQLRRGKLVTGGMGLAANFADHFGEATAVPKSGVGVSKLGAAMAGSAASGAAYLHSPALAVTAAASAAAPYATRAAILSRVGQNALAQPNYAPNALATAGYQGLNYLPRLALPGELSVDPAQK